MKLRLFVNMGFHFFYLYKNIYKTTIYINQSKIAVGDKIFECFCLYISEQEKQTKYDIIILK